jgi:hypothetical protein
MFFHGNSKPAISDTEAGWRAISVVEECQALAVPNLKRLTGLRVGRLDMPLEQVLRLPHNADRGDFVKIVLPNVVIDKDEAGEPVLMRSRLSNFGVWQKGETVWVRGEWDEVPAAPAPVVPPKGK